MSNQPTQRPPKTVSPPKFLVDQIADFLPPDCREQILGDLEERYREAPRFLRWITYLRDANSIIPRLVWARRSSWNIRDVGPALVMGDLASVRRQVEWFQMQNYWRFLFYFWMVTAIGVVFLVAATQMRDPLKVAVIVGMLVVLRFTAFLHRKRGAAHVVPGDASLAELVAFHKAALERRYRFLRGLWYWKMLPMLTPWIVARAVQGRLLDVVPGTIAILAYVLLMTSLAARRVRQQIDALPEIPT